MRDKKRNTFLWIEILFFANAINFVTLFYRESFVMLNLNLWFEYRRVQKDSILSAFFIKLAILDDGMSLMVRIWSHVG